ncbi:MULTISPECIES: hypothetical protein [unclassified Enterococcus]|uniref:hypothetical protein n=1 Tax=unclassified Enterococcus TaxID=2608891 RepID=UPI001CE18C99|nr:MULTISPECIES: hypothetical protein [unclassified Enterococcus]MCA5011572.1 hypothetical protein [Enterococcus sp. S23]MCA5014986.1 hypothetical protein [Enterococcus sp. S22(2020)]
MKSQQEVRAQYNYEQDISDDVYEKILSMTIKARCDHFEFTIRHDIDFMEDYSYSYNPQTYQLLDELSEFLVKVEKTNRWATSLVISYEIVADVYRYKLNQASLAIMLRYSKKISDWCGPTLPEDIAFFEGEKMWMGTVGHEVESVWHLTESEYQEINSLGIDPWKS